MQTRKTAARVQACGVSGSKGGESVPAVWIAPYDPAIARVLLAFEPPDGGVPEHVAHLALGLGDHGHEVEVAGPVRASTYDRLEEAGIPIHRMTLARGYTRPHRDLAALRGLVRVLRNGRYDLVHGHAAKAGTLARLAARAARLPAVYTPHCYPFAADTSAGWRALFTVAERALARVTAATICVCEDERRVAAAAGIRPAERLHVIHNGSEPCAPVDPDPALAAMRAGGPLAAAIAVMRRQKRIDVFLDAAPLVLARVPEARLVVVGEGPLSEDLHARAAGLGLDRDARFAFLPFVGPSARYLRAIDVYVLSSAWEAFPIGVLEALACGVPQVATDVGGTREIVDEQTGMLVPPRDPAALADALVALLTDAPRRERLGRAARARHAERFGLERMVAATAALYERLLSSAA